MAHVDGRRGGTLVRERYLGKPETSCTRQQGNFEKAGARGRLEDLLKLCRAFTGLRLHLQNIYWHISISPV